MKYLSVRSAQLIFVVMITIFLTGCATTMAPNYNRVIVEGLISINKKTMELFASTSLGTNSATYYGRSKTYNTIIGNIDALIIQLKARPKPRNKIIGKVNKYLQSRGVNLLEDEVTPSATALEKVSETITKMRDTDKKQGLTSFEVKLFKGQTIIYLDQALTYEAFLER
ncbi:MAG: hypothetical protein CR982_06200 [Candidatus Cloacimonadota bacterium]|nr:MAG: hypothetical protein CR982_06200 [Candidatus Cloacimonadota bacterium]PIE78112.1 MAG: hypothetical protein CSA15_09760 [Candidatus Delongbacteria bacterium]